MGRNSLRWAVFTLLLFGCGGNSSSSLSGSYEVTDVDIIASDINIGEAVRVEVFFETKTEPDGFPDGVDVVVRIPAELSFVEGSSRLYDGSTDDSDAFTPHRVMRCESGETFLEYNFDDFDLFDHEVAGIGSFGIRLEVRGESSAEVTLVGASADFEVTYECGEFFEAEKSQALKVL